MDALASAIDIEKASQMWWKYRKPNLAAHCRAHCAVQQNPVRVGRATAARKFWALLSR